VEINSFCFLSDRESFNCQLKSREITQFFWHGQWQSFKTFDIWNDVFSGIQRVSCFRKEFAHKIEKSWYRFLFPAPRSEPEPNQDQILLFSFATRWKWCCYSTGNEKWKNG
jgi:hypothetical protein